MYKKIPKKKKKKKRKERDKLPMCTCTWAFSSIKWPICKCTWAFSFIKQLIFFLQFSPYFGKKTFWWVRRENIQVLSFIFLPPHLTKHNLEKFSFPFSLQSFPSTIFHLQTNTPQKFTSLVLSFTLSLQSLLNKTVVLTSMSLISTSL